MRRIEVDVGLETAKAPLHRHAHLPARERDLALRRQQPQLGARRARRAEDGAEQCEEPAQAHRVTPVSDTGVGISYDVLPKLFKIGEKIKTNGTANETGTGLGLILCAEFIQKNHGTIKVESTVGVGSQFIVTLPLVGVAY